MEGMEIVSQAVLILQFLICVCRRGLVRDRDEEGKSSKRQRKGTVGKGKKGSSSLDEIQHF